MSAISMKYVLVTGAYGGMGKSTVEALVREGYTVIALDKRVEEPQDGIIPLQADITDEQSVKDACERTKEITDTLYGIIHFAGVYVLDSLIEMPSESYRRAFDINFFGAFLINKSFFPLLKKGSRIIITTSELAPLDPLPFTGVYAVTKGALDKYAYSLCMELQLLGISVSVLRAGAVNTGMLGASTDALDSFCQSTELYDCNARRFNKIVNKVEARNISSERLARKATKILRSKRPKFAYTINRNPLLLMLNALPKRLQLWIIRRVLK